MSTLRKLGCGRRWELHRWNQFGSGTVAAVTLMIIALGGCGEDHDDGPARGVLWHRT
jgi:hypothetical protein